MAGKPQDHRVELLNRLLNMVEDPFRLLAFVGFSRPMPGEIDGATSDSRPGEAEIPSGIQLLGRGSAVHPEQEGNFSIWSPQGLSLWPNDQGRDVWSESGSARDGSEAGWEDGVKIGHAVEGS